MLRTLIMQRQFLFFVIHLAPIYCPNQPKKKIGSSVDTEIKGTKEELVWRHQLLTRLSGEAPDPMSIWVREILQVSVQVAQICGCVDQDVVRGATTSFHKVVGFSI
jgi:hypothetical protein